RGIAILVERDDPVADPLLARRAVAVLDRRNARARGHERGPGPGIAAGALHAESVLVDRVVGPRELHGPGVEQDCDDLGRGERLERQRSGAYRVGDADYALLLPERLDLVAVLLLRVQSAVGVVRDLGCRRGDGGERAARPCGGAQHLEAGLAGRVVLRTEADRSRRG